MSEFTGQTGMETRCSVSRLEGTLGKGDRYPLYVGLDVHKDTIAVGLAWPGRGEPGCHAEIANTPKAKNASRAAKVIAWRAQKGLCGRYRALGAAGKKQKVVCVAIARELAGFVWDIVCQEMGKRRAAWGSHRAFPPLAHRAPVLEARRRWTRHGKALVRSELDEGEDFRPMGSGHSQPVWRILDGTTSAPQDGSGDDSTVVNPALRRRPAPRRSEVGSVTNPRISD